MRQKLSSIVIITNATGNVVTRACIRFRRAGPHSNMCEIISCNYL